MTDYSKCKVYSPDVVPYSFEGKRGIIGTVAYTFVAPIRLVSRIMHNIWVMPADIQDEFAEGLFVVAGIVAALGLVDLLVWHKWVLLASQIPLFPYAYFTRKAALEASELAHKKREVDFDYEQIETLVGGVYDELNKVIKE